MAEIDDGYIIKFLGDDLGRGVIATREFVKGQTILREQPLVSCQFAWNAEYGYAACHFCLEPLETAQENVTRLANDPNILLPHPDCCSTRTTFHVRCEGCGVRFCSTQCREEAWNRWHKVLCPRSQTLDQGHPFFKLVNDWKSFHYPPETVSIVLFVRILASIVQAEDPAEEIKRYMSMVHSTKLHTHATDMVHKMLGDSFSFQLDTLRHHFSTLFPQPCVQELLTPDGFASLFALVGRNGQGVGTSAFSQWINGVTKKRMTDAERKSMDELIERIYQAIDAHAGDFRDNEGSGLFEKQSCINHSCVPNAQIEFPFNNHELVVNALTNIQPGDQITISYLSECELSSSRHSRQKQLKENYLFVCQCPKCQEQINDPDVTSDEEMTESEEEEEEEAK